MESVLYRDISRILEIRFDSGLSTNRDEYYEIKHAILFNSYLLLRDPTKRIGGYAIWADVCDESARRFLCTGEKPKYAFEWGEGNVRLLLDVVVGRLFSEHLLYKLKKHMSDTQTLIYSRRGSVRVIDRKKATI